MKNTCKWFGCGLIALISWQVTGQSGQPLPAVREISRSQALGTPSYIHLSDPQQQTSTLPTADAIATYFQMGEDEIAVPTKVMRYGEDITVEKYQQMYRGVPVEHGRYAVLKKDGKTQSIHAEHYPLRDLRTSPGMAEEAALNKALDDLGSALYAWEATRALLATRSDLPVALRDRLETIAKEEYPQGELVIVRDFYREGMIMDLAYKFVIESVDPLFKDYVYVNAHDGRIMLRDPIIKHGTGETRYAGTRTFPTSEFGSGVADTFQLRGIEPISGVLCETRSVNGFGGLPLSIAAVYALSTPILDGDQADPCLLDGDWTVDETGDDSWDKEEHWRARFETAPPPDVSCCVTYTPSPGTCNELENDDIALDAQWGASVVAQYWQVRHGRNSFDDAGADLISFVHYGDAYNNAFWNGSFMTYGDGSAQKPLPDYANGDFGPFTSLDICAHEIGHAICSHTSDLVYQKESGAMNEGLSDIWAAAIERYVLDSIDATLPFDPYGIGEQIDDRDDGLPPGHQDAYAIRWMDDPKSGASPDTYQGERYFPTEPPICAAPNLATDYCGVHLNSGVLNKWFYLLTEGSGKAFTPGRGLIRRKVAFDDEINDQDEVYHVVGLGNDASERITFLAETLLSPNALFADMRNASIEAARALYGLCSIEEVQTTNAWHAVGVGDTFMICEPRIEFGVFNPDRVSERSDDAGCTAQSVVTLTLHSYQMAATIQFETAGNAIPGEDFVLATSQLTFDGTEINYLDVIIYDDKFVEGPDTILIGFASLTFADTAMIIIQDDDVIPAIGDSVTLLAEGFSSDSIPVGWQQFAINIESSNHWEFNGAGLGSGAAYVTVPGSPVPEYDPARFSHVRLVSPPLDARGRSGVSISFDWSAGGESDVVENSVLFDYGTFQVSLDGQHWTDIEDFVGDAGGLVPAIGTYDTIHPELDNEVFYLGFKWYNDGLIGSTHSFTIDNVVVTAEDMDIAHAAASAMQTIVPSGTTVAFVSPDSSELIGMISDASGDLGCVELKVDTNHALQDLRPAFCDYRSEKVFGLSAPNTTDSFTLTLYFRAGEVDEWLDPASLNILAVKSTDVDNLWAGYSILTQDVVEVDDQLAADAEYIAFSFRTTAAFRTYALTDRQPHAVSRTVMNTTDSDFLSLRERVAVACPLDTITFAPALNGETIHLTGPEIAIGRDIVILGPGSAHILVSGNDEGRIFRIDPDVVAILQGMTICCGDAMGEGDAILNNGHLIVRDVRFTID